MQDNNPIKDSFERVKKDIFTLGNELANLRNQLSSIKSSINIHFLLDLFLEKREEEPDNILN